MRPSNKILCFTAAALVTYVGSFYILMVPNLPACDADDRPVFGNCPRFSESVRAPGALTIDSRRANVLNYIYYPFEWIHRRGQALMAQAGAVPDLRPGMSLRERFQFFRYVCRTYHESGDTLSTVRLAADEELQDKRKTPNQLMDKDSFVKSLRSVAESLGVTNFTLDDLETAFFFHTNTIRMLMVDPDLPLSVGAWPPPSLEWTNQTSGVMSFIKQHGWMMEMEPTFFLAIDVPTAPISGLPWPQISRRTFEAVTRSNILYVPLMAFGAESTGVAWNPQTNHFDPAIGSFRPLEGGWYAWSQVAGPSPSSSRRYEGEEVPARQQDGAATGSQPIRPETNRTSSAAGSRR